MERMPVQSAPIKKQPNLRRICSVKKGSRFLLGKRPFFESLHRYLPLKAARRVSEGRMLTRRAARSLDNKKPPVVSRETADGRDER